MHLKSFLQRILDTGGEGWVRLGDLNFSHPVPGFHSCKLNYLQAAFWERTERGPQNEERLQRAADILNLPLRALLTLST